MPEGSTVNFLSDSNDRIGKVILEMMMNKIWGSGVNNSDINLTVVKNCYWNNKL